MLRAAKADYYWKELFCCDKIVCWGRVRFIFVVTENCCLETRASVGFSVMWNCKDLWKCHQQHGCFCQQHWTSQWLANELGRDAETYSKVWHTNGSQQLFGNKTSRNAHCNIIYIYGLIHPLFICELWKISFRLVLFVPLCRFMSPCSVPGKHFRFCV